MSTNNDPTRNVTYDPLPLTNDDFPSTGNILYNAPPSPDPNLLTFHTPQMDPAELEPDDHTLPLGAAQPRFLGAAFYDGSRSVRDSYTSSNHTLPGQHSEYNSSLYALNDPHGTSRFDGDYRDDPHDNMVVSSPPSGAGRILAEKRAAYAPSKATSKRTITIVAIIVALVLVIAAVVVPLYLFVLKPKNRTSVSGNASASGSAANPASTSTSSGSNVRVTGGDGTVITMDDGTTFIYNNSFGGYWYWDENDPFNQGARAQSWSPALNETFNYGVDQIRGSVLN